MKSIATLTTLTLALNAFAQSNIEGLVNNLVSSDPSTGESRVIIHAQLEPNISNVVKNNQASCELPLTTQDLNQMKSDEFLVQSFLDLYKLAPSRKKMSMDSNFFMSILLQKARGSIEAVAENGSRSSNSSFLNKLTQNDLMVVKFASNVDAIRSMNMLITAHQSLEVPHYNIDGYLKMATVEFLACRTDSRKCVNENLLWPQWFKNQGFGIVSPSVNRNMVTNGNATTKENFEIKLSVGSRKSQELIKNLLELTNIYGGEKFDYFAYLKGEKLKAEQGLNDGKIFAPGKIVAGVMLKLANQRLVGYYKYQKCRLLKQNGKIADLVSNGTTSSNRVNSQSQSQSAQLHVCNGNNCSSGTQVTSGNQALALSPQSASVSSAASTATGPASCADGLMWTSARVCVPCLLEGYKPTDNKLSCVFNPEFCADSANWAKQICSDKMCNNRDYMWWDKKKGVCYKAGGEPGKILPANKHSAEVHEIYAYIGRRSDRIDEEGSKHWQARLDAGESVEALKIEAKAASDAADRILKSKGIAETSQQLLNGDQPSRLRYYELIGQ